MPPAARPPKEPPKAGSSSTEANRQGHPAERLDRAALLAHQLRSPLSTITGLSQGLMRRADRLSLDEIRGRAEKIWHASLRVNELVEAIMSYTRLSTGTDALNPSRFDLRSLVGRVAREQVGSEPGRPLELDVRALPTSFLGDPVLLAQALAILLSNALKYGPPRSPIRVSGSVEDGTVAICVEDEGIGVTDEDLPYLTQPFFRGGNAKDVPGTGLGLSLAWHILRLHRGNLHIRRRKSRGTSVTILLREDGLSGRGAAN